MSVEQKKSVKENEEYDESSDQHENEFTDADHEEETLSDEETSQLIEDQHKRLIELEEELERMKDSQLRKAAEMDNMRKRLNRERDIIFQTARESAIAEFLPISDDLIRTVNALEDDGANSSILDGIKMIADKFDGVLEKHGVKRIDQTDIPFDVNLHDAMLTQKVEDDSVESGTVLQVVENGYTIGEKTLRHAKVIVSE